jgi:hypothetical protein
MDPIPPKEINERRQGNIGPWRFENRQKDDTQCECTDQPSEVNTLHSTSTPNSGR